MPNKQTKIKLFISFLCGGEIRSMSNPLTLAPPKTKLLQQFSSNQPPPQYLHMLPKSQSMYETPVKYQQTNFTHPLFSKCSRDVNNKHQNRNTAKFLFLFEMFTRFAFITNTQSHPEFEKLWWDMVFHQIRDTRRNSLVKCSLWIFQGSLRHKQDSICQHL